MQILKQQFNSGGDQCAADLYLPQDTTNPPIVVMAHGFAAERAFGLPAFAERFCEMGLAILLFDYRSFGDSQGSPRQLVDPARHLADWRAAISHARSLAEVDGQNLALWGSSFSGGHVISIAAEDHSIRAIVAQVPFVSGWNLMKGQPLKNLLRLSLAATRDAVGSLFGLSPHYYPVVAKPGERGIMNTPESYDGYMRLAPEGTSWTNGVPARIGLLVPLYSPLRKASGVRCPALIVAGRHDSLIPVSAVREMAGRINGAEFQVLETNHFQPYVEEAFEINIGFQQRFLKQQLLGKPAG